MLESGSWGHSVLQTPDLVNIQKDANERKLTQAGRTNVAVYTCTKFAVCFVYVGTNNSWQILYLNHVL